jgi:hypothetical protein
MSDFFDPKRPGRIIAGTIGAVAFLHLSNFPVALADDPQADFPDVAVTVLSSSATAGVLFPDISAIEPTIIGEPYEFVPDQSIKYVINERKK